MYIAIFAVNKCQDVERIVEQLRHFSVFSHNGPDLICLATNDVAPENIKDALLSSKDRGQAKVREFVQSRLIGTDVSFHDTLKQTKSLTLKNMYW